MPLIPVSTYVPALSVAAVVTWLELRQPNRDTWRPSMREVRTDLIFMVVVQLALPPLVGFGRLCICAVEPNRPLHLPTARLWPHSSPIWVQAVLMVLAVDFTRYWLHRACSSERYAVAAPLRASLGRAAVNSAKHGTLPPDSRKALQMCLDSLPVLAHERGRQGARSVLPRVRFQRLLPTLQRPPALRLPELHRRKRRDAPLAPFA